jgi:hypothetical protein
VTETVTLAIIVGLPPTIAALTAAYVAIHTKRAVTHAVGRVEQNVEKIERQTNSMSEQMVVTARKEGEQTGKDKAEIALANAATVATAITSRPISALPLTMHPVSNEAEVIKWIEYGQALEKSRREREGNGPKT